MVAVELDNQTYEQICQKLMRHNTCHFRLVLTLRDQLYYPLFDKLRSQLFFQVEDTLRKQIEIVK